MLGVEPTTPRAGVREQRRQTRHVLRRRERVRRRLERGQTLVIFALSLTALLGLAGLTIDVARAYDLFARMQRAAEAGALAGVLYLPNNYNTVRSGSVDSAISAASKAVIMNGFGTTPLSATASACGGGQEVQVCQVPNRDTDLEVIITEQMDTVLLSGLGVQPITLVAKGQATYDPTPVVLTSRQSYVGDAMECSSASSLNTASYACNIGASVAAGDDHLQYEVAAFDGPAELKEWGDPYVYCAEGPERPRELSPPGPDPNTNTLITYNGLVTNHPQWSDVVTGSPISTHCGEPVEDGGNPGNPDQQPDRFVGPVTEHTAFEHGYNYFLTVNTTGDNSLWIYNPGFMAHDLSTTPPLTLDHFLDPAVVGPLMPSSGAPPADPSYYMGPQGEGIGSKYDGVHHDAPLFYFTITYSLYRVVNILDHQSDGPILAQETFKPYDATSADLGFHGCTAGKVYDPLNAGQGTPNWYHQPATVTAGTGCVPLTQDVTTQCMLQWCPLLTANGGAPYDLTNGTYRLVIERVGLTALAQTAGVTDYNSGPQDGYGQHGYAMKLCAALASNLPSGPVNCNNGTGQGAGNLNVPPLNFAGWNNGTINLIEPLTTQNINLNFPNTSCVSSNALPYSCHDFVCVPTAYAGHTIDAQIFDPGDVATGDLYIGIVPPHNANGTVTYPASSYVTTVSKDGDTVFQSLDTGHSNYRPYNGLWVNIQLQLASTYVGDCSSSGIPGSPSGWWQLVAIGPTNAIPNDMITYQVTVVGSPVHLVIPT